MFYLRCTWPVLSWKGLLAIVLLALASNVISAQSAPDASPLPRPGSPPRVSQAQRFLQQRSHPNRRSIANAQPPFAATLPRPLAATLGAATWQPLGPLAVSTPNHGLISGRVTSIAIDPSDSSGNHVYVGTTGGGVWFSNNAAASDLSTIQFKPLTDSALPTVGVNDPSISIGAISIQPGGTGVVLAGTGDPNDALDSYYGAGILRSTDSGATWKLIPYTADSQYFFTGEGFAGFAWSTTNPQVVVAAVSQAYEGTLTRATWPQSSYQGLYVSKDSGATWSLATITDGSGSDVQGPTDIFTAPDGNAATSVVWNPFRRLFLAAIRYHGYYQSPDGVIWTRVAAQPGTGLTAQMCPTNPSLLGSIACPIFRGTLAVNPNTGDTFAWTVDVNDQDQGLWQDQCALSSGVCTNQNISFGLRRDTTPLQSNTLLGPKTIANGDYTLALAAVPYLQDTLLFAGADDLWKCSLANSCAWRNTTNSTTCMSAQVAEYQHAFASNAPNFQSLFIGNDGGLWRSTDNDGESGPVCSASDATHFQNLNGSLGSLAEVESLSPVVTSPYTLLAGLGVNGAAGVKSTQAPTQIWPQVLTGEGGPVAIDPTNPSNWYVNNQAGVAIHLCAQSGACTAADFGNPPVVTNADVGGDGSTMVTPASFLVDPLDSKQLLVATCRIWRGPADGSAWTSSNAISPFLDGIASGSFCNGNALIRSIAALPLSDGTERIYVGIYGKADGGANLAGHVLATTFDPENTVMSAWQDLSFNPVTNDNSAFNAFGFGISSIFVDPHDQSGNTVYITVAGMPTPSKNVRNLYRSIDGGAHWTAIASKLRWSPANSIVVDPQDANTVYVALDSGVFSTRQIATCTDVAVSCWSPFGARLPQAPVTQLSVSPASVTPSVLVAGTYGRGIWQIPLWTSGLQLTTATVDPLTLTFPSQTVAATSTAQSVTLTNTGGLALVPSTIAISGDFAETDNCKNATLNAGESCTLQVAFTPSQPGVRTGQLMVSGNISNGQLSVSLTGTGQTAYSLTASPSSLAFAEPTVGTASDAQTVTITNPGYSSADALTFSVSAPFNILQTSCSSSLAAGQSCIAAIVFTPTATGKVSGVLTISSATFAPTSVALSGLAGAAGTVTLNPPSFTFAVTGVGTASAAQTITVANTGAMPLTDIALAVSSGFRQLNTTCASPLAVGASCTIQIAFAPMAAGPQSGTFTLSSNELAADAIAPLNGTGFDFAIAVPGVSSQSVASGQSASYALSVTSLAGSAGTVALACGALPARASCIFNPSTVNLTGTAGGMATVQIATGQAVSTSHAPALSFASGLLVCSVFFLPLALRRRHALYPLALLALLFIWITACSGSGGGGGGTPPGNKNTTPSGTYAIPVTATSNGVTHQLTLTLVVD